ncbi:uncharacterized protein F5Z01DRAFT_672880 [Emericellopsis atlantica]|uniref:WW domain-containing protein n=1 Tax=Emericellopsis atlantica TaxID=2614577 RepID=A0A9P8CQW4_9HYPO|nr:uncharacterized protein F5Z01DRAFT_672880 [Emericellopsis atlantica]KAG9255570.1 hypothetical protein F5Z01DRAFT_672880 [Emericellopsis atlantica]
MLKSTYQRADAAAPEALPPGWTEHKAPTGHTYYYNASTKESTYKRPSAQPEAPSIVPTYGPNLSDPSVANAYVAQFNPPPAQQSHRGGFGAGRGGRGGYEGRPKPAPIDKPVKKEPIPGHEPWILVYTKYSRRFVYNPVKKTSFWRIPEKLMPGILELDKERIRRKSGNETDPKSAEPETAEAEEATVQRKEETPTAAPEAYDSSEYEEVEVTDDEDEEGHASKRQRTDDAAPEEEEEPVEFTEADIAAQLQAMGTDYGLEPGDYDDGNMADWPEGAEGVEFSEEDAKLLFKDLLDDFRINPFSPWEKLIEEGRIIEDQRYTALPTTRARKECWDEWSREKIAAQKEQRAKQEKKDPRIAYMALLQEKATPKLYWPEFKRKYKKEPPMKDLNLSDKDREKAYRDLVNRLKTSQATRKTELTTMLKSLPLHVLNNRSLADGLPTQLLVDPRYAALEPSIRDGLIEAYVQGLPPPPDNVEDAKAASDEREKREKRTKALEERNRVIDEEKRQRERDIARGKARLRDGERDIEMAMAVDKTGLRRQLEDAA